MSMLDPALPPVDVMKIPVVDPELLLVGDPENPWLPPGPGPVTELPPFDVTALPLRDPFPALGEHPTMAARVNPSPNDADRVRSMRFTCG
jgi:hypothetical protein